MPYVAGTHDDVLKRPYIYHGPYIDVAWLPFTLRFRGRPLDEWKLLFIGYVPMWFAADLPLIPFRWATAQLGATPPVVSLFAVVAHVVAAWWAASTAATHLYRRLVDTDRSMAYLRTTFTREDRRVVWARGPYNPRVFAAAAVLWFPVTWALGALPVPQFVVWLVAARLVRPVSRSLVAAFEDPERVRRREIERARRQPSIALRVTGEAL